MAENKQYGFIKIMGIILWTLMGAGTILLLIAAISKKNSKHCKEVIINISGVQNNFFIDKKDVTVILNKMYNGKPEAQVLSAFDLAAIETEIQKNPWIKSAQVFFDNNDDLSINILEREPIARIFSINGSSLYIDSSCVFLPLSEKFSARLPVFTNFPSTSSVLSKDDSDLLAGIRNVAKYIVADQFWMAQIDQVDITPERTFEMVPKIGNHLIEFGNAENCEEKFHNLFVFYKEVGSKAGWNKYSKIDVQYKGQVVAVKRGAEDIKMDSLRAKQIMLAIVASAQKAANDSAKNIQLAQQQDDNNILLASVSNDSMPDENINQAIPSIKKETIIPANTNGATPVINKPKPQNELSNTVDHKPFKKKNIPATKIFKSPEKAKSVTVKKAVVNKPILKANTNKPIEEKAKPKTITPPKNDY